VTGSSGMIHLYLILMGASAFVELTTRGFLTLILLTQGNFFYIFSRALNHTTLILDQLKASARTNLSCDLRKALNAVFVDVGPGAGIGRVSADTLLPLIHDVVLLEPVESLLPCF
jgi:hypothetical protein